MLAWNGAVKISAGRGGSCVSAPDDHRVVLSVFRSRRGFVFDMSVPIRVGVVILDYNQTEKTTRCLSSLEAGVKRPDAVSLVNNGRVGLESIEKFSSFDLPITILSPERNLGCAGGRNAGLAHLIKTANVTRFVILDNDTTVPVEFIELL